MNSGKTNRCAARDLQQAASMFQADIQQKIWDLGMLEPDRCIQTSKLWTLYVRWLGYRRLNASVVALYISCSVLILAPFHWHQEKRSTQTISPRSQSTFFSPSMTRVDKDRILLSLKFRTDNSQQFTLPSSSTLCVYLCFKITFGLCHTQSGCIESTTFFFTVLKRALISLRTTQWAILLFFFFPSKSSHI